MSNYFPLPLHLVRGRKLSTFHMGIKVGHFLIFKYYQENDMTGIPFVMVPTLVLDDLVAEGAIREPNLIKIDVQGHGAEVIVGSIKTIERRRPIIVFSNHSPAELDGTRRLLEPLGYRAVDLNGETVAWSDVSEVVLLPDTAGTDHNCQPGQIKKKGLEDQLRKSGRIALQSSYVERRCYLDPRPIEAAIAIATNQLSANRVLN
jgi:hypothetical protein